MVMLSLRWQPIGYVMACLLGLVLYNEWLVYYVVLLQCQWPQLDVETVDYSVDEPTLEPLRVMLLADTHLLGSREGHWFDKLRREWQMERSFQASMLIHEPEQVFILGDLFDEGKWCSEQEFQYYVARLRKMFSTPTKANFNVVVGNHDIGFHHMIDDRKRHRFSKAFSVPSVQLLHVKENAFVLLNSMAFEGDDCNMCREAELQLEGIVHSLDCTQGTGKNCPEDGNEHFVRPIVLQHFPLYRESDANCSGVDSAPDDEKYVEMVQRRDCLAKSVSDKLLSSLRPRLVVSGHTHHFCQTMHANKTPEWTVPSFSWRYKNGPSFILLLVNRNNYSISKCYLPHESTVIRTYIFGSILILVFNLLPRKLSFNHRTAKLQ